MFAPRLGCRFWFYTLALSCLGWTPHLPAQEAAQKPPAVSPAANAPPPPSSSSDKPEPWWKVFVPYQELKGLLPPSSRTVFLTLQQYEELRKAARESSDPAVTQASLSSAVYTATIDERNLVVRGKLAFFSAAKSWSLTKLDFGSGKLADVKWTTPGPLLIRDSSGATVALLPSGGEYQAEFEILYPLTTRDGETFVSFQGPPAPLSTLQVASPRPGVPVNVREKLPLTPGEDPSAVKIALGAEASAQLFWPAPQPPGSEEQRIFSASQELTLRFAPGKGFLEGKVSLQRQRGAWGRLQFVVPDGAKVLNVQSPEISKWTLATEENRSLVNVDLNPSAEAYLEVTFLLELPIQEGALEKVALSTIGANREAGFLSIISSEDLEVSIQERTGLISSGADEIPDRIRSERAEYFRFYSPDYSLKVSVREQQPRIRAESLSIARISDREIRFSADFQYRVDQAGLYTAAFKISEGLEIAQVESEKMRDFSLSEGGKRLDVRFSGKVLGDVRLSIRGRLPLTPGATESLLPSIEPLGTHFELGRLHLLAQDSLEISTDPAKTSGVVPGNQSLPEEEGLREVSNWTFNSRPIQIPIAIVRKPARITAEAATTVLLKPKFAEVRSHIDFDVAYSGVSQFVISLPDRPDLNVRIEDAENQNLLKQAVAGEAIEGWKAWTLQTQRDVIGSAKFIVKYDLPLPEAQSGKLRLEIHPPRLLGAGTQGKPSTLSGRGEIGVKSDDLWSISTSADGMEEIDVRELESLPRDLALAYRYFESPNPTSIPLLKLDLERLGRQDVVKTIVSRGLIELVLTYEKFAYYRCRYRITSSERQRLAIQLGPDVEPLHLAVAGKSTLLERPAADSEKSGLFYINVDRSTPTDQEFDVQVVYRMPVRPLLRHWLGGLVSPDLPRIGATDDASPAVVQEQRLVIWTPLEIELVGSPTDFRLESDATRWFRRPAGDAASEEWEAWIGTNPAPGVEFPVLGHARRYRALGNVTTLSVQWWRWNWIVILITVAMMLAAWVVRKTSWSNRLSLILVTAFLMMVVGSADGDLFAHLFRASRFGLLAVVILWGFQDLKRLLSAGTGQRGIPVPASATPGQAIVSTDAPLQNPSPDSRTPPPEETST